MANIHKNLNDLFLDIADALRAITGQSDEIAADFFPAEIDALVDNTIFLSLLDGSIESIPDENLEGLTSIGEYAFSNCPKLTSVEIPESVMSVGEYAFGDCTRLKSVTFKGIPENISLNAFNSCLNLTTINVPWIEGAVENAPWGATNATINYNYTEGGSV